MVTRLTGSPSCKYREPHVSGGRTCIGGGADRGLIRCHPCVSVTRACAYWPRPDRSSLDPSLNAYKRDLNDSNRFLRQGEDVAGLREADAPQQRLRMKSVGDDHERLKRIGHAKRPQVLRGNKDCQAMGLEAPKLVVIDEIVQLLGDGGAALLVSKPRAACPAQSRQLPRAQPGAELLAQAKGMFAKHVRESATVRPKPARAALCEPAKKGRNCRVSGPAPTIG